MMIMMVMTIMMIMLIIIIVIVMSYFLGVAYGFRICNCQIAFSIFILIFDLCFSCVSFYNCVDFIFNPAANQQYSQ